MPCYKPLRIRNKRVNPRVVLSDPVLDNCSLNDFNARYRYVPCGKCKGCLSDYVLKWKTRLNLEVQNNPRVIFATLTISNEYYGREPSEYIREFCLNYHRLYRHSCKRFFVPEYGERNSCRLHFHGFFFEYDFDVYAIEGKNYLGSDTFGSLWPFGFWTLLPFEYGSINYTLDYIYKSVEKTGKRPPVFSSNGLGLSNLKSNVDFSTPFPTLSTDRGNIPLVGYLAKKVMSDEQRLSRNYIRELYSNGYEFKGVKYDCEEDMLDAISRYYRDNPFRRKPLLNTLSNTQIETEFDL